VDKSASHARLDTDVAIPALSIGQRSSDAHSGHTASNRNHSHRCHGAQGPRARAVGSDPGRRLRLSCVSPLIPVLTPRGLPGHLAGWARYYLADLLADRWSSSRFICRLTWAA